jgi:hypothetical protein
MKTKTLQSQLSGRFAALGLLHDGWIEGKGVAPDKRKLWEISRRMTADYPHHIPLPAIVPTPEGNLLFEWALPGDPSVDLDLSSMQAAFHVFLSSQDEIEREFGLITDHAWDEFFDFLGKTLVPNEA